MRASLKSEVCNAKSPPAGRRTILAQMMIVLIMALLTAPIILADDLLTRGQDLNAAQALLFEHGWQDAQHFGRIQLERR
jgi:hypothetical protein